MTEQPESEPIIDIDVALVYTDGDREMLASVAAQFLEEATKQLQCIRQAIDAGNMYEVCKAAHTLKGSVVLFGASRAEAAASALETAADEQQTAKIPEAYDSLNQEMQRAFGEIEKLCSP